MRVQCFKLNQTKVDLFKRWNTGLWFNEHHW